MTTSEGFGGHIGREQEWGGIKFIAAVALLITAEGLGGCATAPLPTPQPIVITKEVVVPGPPVKCVPDNVGSQPAYPDTDAALKAAKDPAERYQLVAAGRPLRIARLAVLEPVIASCAKTK